MVSIIDLVILTNLVFVSLTVLWDIRIHKIPNVFVLILFIFNLLSNICFFVITDTGESDFSAVLIVLIKVILIFIILYPFYSIGALGAGDVKLIVATSLGCKEPLLYTLVVFLIAAIISLIRMGVNKNAKIRLMYLYSYLSHSFHNYPLHSYEDAPNASDKLKHSVHLSVPVFIALILKLFFVIGY